MIKNIKHNHALSEFFLLNSNKNESGRRLQLNSNGGQEEKTGAWAWGALAPLEML